jgi:hypothetical protein
MPASKYSTIASREKLINRNLIRARAARTRGEVLAVLEELAAELTADPRYRVTPALVDRVKAHALNGWTIQQSSTATGLSVPTVRQIRRGEHTLTTNSLR